MAASKGGLRETWAGSAARRLDWPQVALILGALALALAAAYVLEIDGEKLAAISPEQWILLASSVTGVITTIGAALRGRVLAPAPVSRERPTDPPSRTGGHVDPEALVWILVWAMAAALAFARMLGGAT